MDCKNLCLFFLLCLFCFQNIPAQTFDPILQKNYPHFSQITNNEQQTQHTRAISPFTTNAWEFTGPEGGRVSCISMDSSNNTIFAAIQGGGLFTSNNQAQTWSKYILNDEYNASLVITGLDFNNGRLLAATEGGIYKSMDNGQTWEWLSWMKGFKILSFPAYLDTIMVGVYMAGSWNPGGFFRSNDGGMTWLQYNEGLVSTQITDLELSPHHSGRVFACTTDGVYFSDNCGNDGWTNINGDLPSGPVISLLCDKFVENSLYVCMLDGLYKSNNGGIDWINITPDVFPDKSPRVIFQDSDSSLYVGTSNGLFLTRNTGISWQAINQGLYNTAINAINSDQNNHVMVGTEDGFYVKSRQDTVWQRKVSGMHALNVDCLLIETDTNSPAIYIGTGGAGIYYKNANIGWQDAGVDSGLCYVMDIQKAHDNHAIYAEVVDGYSRKYTDTIFKIFSLPVNDLLNRQILLPYSIYREIACLLVYSRDILFFGGNNGIYRTINGGNDWEQLHYSAKINPVTSIICPENSSAIFAGTQIDPDNYHGIYKSTNMGTTWHNTCRDFYNKFIDIRKINYNPRNPNTMYATNMIGLLKSTNAGESWVLIPEDSISTNDTEYTLAVHPVDTSTVFVAGFQVFFSNNGGVSWQPFPVALPSGSGLINDIAIDPLEPDRIYLATSGNGLLSYKGIETAITKKEPAPPRQFILYNNYPNPFNPETHIRYDLPDADHVILQIYDLQGREVTTLVNSIKSNGQHLATWNGRDSFGNQAASGVYFCRIRYRDFTETRKMILMR